MKILACQYSHIEGYPPTFNAVNIIASQGHQVQVLMRKDMITTWNYHENIKINFVGNYKDRFEFERTSKWHKIKEFIIFVKTLKKLVLENRPDIVLLYDNVPLMAYRMLRTINRFNHKVWYHNHDIHYLKDYKKYSLPYFAYFSLKKSFKFINYFSLPAVERLKYFNLKNYKGKQIILPNYPPSYLYKYKKEIAPVDTIKLVYPGSNISHMHGIEEIIPILNNTVNGKKITLSLVGTIKSNYKNKLLQIADKYQTTQKLFFIDRMSYTQMQKEMLSYDIGVAINKPMNITYETGGSAANKIYEYPASGLPSVLFDNKHYRIYFDRYDWAFFSNLSEDSLLSVIELIDNNYLALSKKAKEDFKEDLYFEKYFIPAFEDIIEQTQK